MSAFLGLFASVITSMYIRSLVRSADLNENGHTIFRKYYCKG